MEYDVSSAEPLLERTPRVLHATVSGLPPAWLDAREKPGTWSIREIVFHMADLERDAWLGRARTFLEPGARGVLGGVERERFRRRYADASVEEALEDFRRLRVANLESLRSYGLGEADLHRESRHPDFGVVLLSQLLSTWVVHDLTHLAQISRTLAAQYREAVGPWADFLSVLGRPERP
jgi:hypothetical protein